MLLLSIAVCVTGVAIEKIFVSSAGKLKKPILLFGAGWTGFVSLCCLVYIILTKSYHLSTVTIYCAVLMGVMVAVNFYTALVAFDKALTLSMLVISMCVIVPSLLSVIFLGEKLKATQIIGFFLIVTVFIFVNNIKNEKGSAVTLSWFIVAIISCLSNGLSMFASKIQQFYLPGLEIPQYFGLSFIIAAIVFLIMYLTLNPKENAKYTYTMHKFSIPMVGVAVAIGGTNLINLILAGRLPAIVLYPSVQYGSMIVTTFISAAFFKEKGGLKTYLGVILGAVAIFILNL